MLNLIRRGDALYLHALALVRKLDWLAPLLLRLMLAPVMIAAGLHKAANFDDMVAWFGNAEWGLGLPFPVLMTFLATVTELVEPGRRGQALALIFRQMHELSGWLLAALLGLHVAGALKHAILDRDATLARMVTGTGPAAPPASREAPGVPNSRPSSSPAA